MDISTQTKILQHITQRYLGKEDIKVLLSTIRKDHPRDIVPCQRDNEVDKHRYQIHGWKPFRLRCALKSCHHNLYEAEAFRWFAQLIEEGTVHRESVGMSTEGGHERGQPQGVSTSTSQVSSANST